MKTSTIGNEKWDSIEKGIKTFEEVFVGVFVIGMIFLLYGWMNLDHISLPALVQFLFVSSWIGVFGLVTAIVLPVIFTLLGKKLRRN